MKLKSMISLIITISLTALLLLGCSSSADTEETKKVSDYPAPEVSGIIQWGSGGGTDSLMRPLAKLAENPLGVSIHLENKTGNAGATATEYVYDEDADGYTLLMGAENPALYDALDISDITYEDFEPIIIIGSEPTGIVVNGSSNYNTLTELVNDALERPDTIKIATAGKGSLPWVASSMLSSVTDASFEEIAYDSDVTAKQAVLDGDCDFTICKVQIGLEDYNNGNLKYLSMLATEPVEQLEGIPLISEEYPAFSEYLPWGPFYGVFVKKETDQEIINILTDAFSTAYNDAAYQDILTSFDIEPLGYTDGQATEYVKTWQGNTVHALEHTN